MKSYKSRALKAIKQIALNYKDPKYSTYKYFSISFCLLCKIYHKYSCAGCPLSTSRKQGSYGCTKFKSYSVAHLALRKYMESSSSPKLKTALRTAFNRRADFLLNSIPELTKYPAKQFTPSGFKPFKLFKDRQNQ